MDSTQTAPPADQTTGVSNTTKLLVGLALLAIVAVSVTQLPVETYLRDLLSWVQGVGLAGAVVLGVVYVVATVLFFPGSVLTLGAGYAFGVLWGTVLVSVASTVGAALSFLVGRFIARDWVRDKIASHPTFEALDSAMEEETLKVVFLLRLVPLIPFNALNYGFGVSSVKFRQYVAASWAGMLPATVMYVYIGSLAEKVTRLAAGTPEAQVPIWALGENLRQLMAGDLSGGVLQNLLYWLGLVATVAVTTVITRRAKAELQKLTESDETMPDAADNIAAYEGPDEMEPDDAHNRRLADHVHPTDWTNPEADETYNLVAIGAGTAGLVSASGAAGLGAKTALIERNLMGGDCLNSGCVPSKALLRSAKAAADARRADRFGVEIDGEVEVDFGKVMERMRRIRADISEEDSAERFDGLGVDVFLGDATFIDEQTLEVDGQRIRFKKAVIATGGRPFVPPIEGLEEAGYLTNETVFSLTERPDRLAVVGGGPIGCELAQAFERFGTDVTVVEMADQILPREEDEAAAIVAEALREDGVDLRVGAQMTRVETDEGHKVVTVEREDGTAETLAVDEILMAVGRVPNVEGLGLEAAGVDVDAKTGVEVDDRLQTTNSRIYAAGDVASRYKFTHTADAQARIVIQNALFFGRSKSSDLNIPWATYTDPEVAHVGLYPDQARQQGFEVETITQPLSEVHRAVIEGADEGFLKVYLKKGSDRILGATLVAEGAGDLISELTLAMEGEVGMGTVSNTIHPYPTTAAVTKRAADAYNRTRLTPWIKSVFETWFRWTR